MSGVDRERFLAICGPGEEDVAEHVEFYLAYMTAQLAALRAAIDAGRARDVELIAHRCAGSAGTWGTDPLVAPCAALERQARDGRLDNALALERDVRTALATIETELRALVARRSPQP